MPKLLKIIQSLLLLVLAESLLISAASAADFGLNNLEIYGYLAWRLEKVWDEPALGADGRTVEIDADREISLPSFNTMLSYEINDRFKTFINLSGKDAENVTVQNMWGEYHHNQYLNIRVGKTYRRFGLYNEILDAVPTYIGIEPPELFDKDHLILSRTSLVMIHGWVVLGDGELNYSWSTDNGEGGPFEDNIPMGYDLHYD